jgi:hypothetical protein
MKDSPQIAREHAKLRRFDYEPDQFRQFFTSPFQQYAERIGQPFTVIGRDWDAEKDLEYPEEMYRIRFEDCTEITAWGHEVCVLILDNCGPFPA